MNKIGDSRTMIVVGSVWVVLLAASSACSAGVVTLGFDSLPSAQGWTFIANPPCPITETQAFSVGDGVLTLDTTEWGYGPGSPLVRYERSEVFTAEEFELSFTARCVTEEVGNYCVPQTFYCLVVVDNLWYGICLGENAVSLPDGGHGERPLVIYSLPAGTGFRHCILRATPGNPEYTVELDSARLPLRPLSDQPQFWHPGDVGVFDDEFLEVMGSMLDHEKLRKGGAKGLGHDHFRRRFVLIHGP